MGRKIRNGLVKSSAQNGSTSMRQRKSGNLFRDFVVQLLVVRIGNHQHHHHFPHRAHRKAQILWVKKKKSVTIGWRPSINQSRTRMSQYILDKSINQSINQQNLALDGRPINQSINRPTESWLRIQSINQSTDRKLTTYSINQSIDRSSGAKCVSWH